MGKSTLPERLRELRAEFGLSQAQIAEHVGLSNRAISNYENGHNVPPQETQERLTKLFGVSLDYLNGRTDVRITAGGEESEDDLDRFLRRHDIWFDGQRLSTSSRRTAPRAP